LARWGCRPTAATRRRPVASRCAVAVRAATTLSTPTWSSARRSAHPADERHAGRTGRHLGGRQRPGAQQQAVDELAGRARQQRRSRSGSPRSGRRRAWRPAARRRRRAARPARRSRGSRSPGPRARAGPSGPAAACGRRGWGGSRARTAPPARGPGGGGDVRRVVHDVRHRPDGHARALCDVLEARGHRPSPP
jgi:hypothetical protein